MSYFWWVFDYKISFLLHLWEYYTSKMKKKLCSVCVFMWFVYIFMHPKTHSKYQNRLMKTHSLKRGEKYLSSGTKFVYVIVGRTALSLWLLFGSGKCLFWSLESAWNRWIIAFLYDLELSSILNLLLCVIFFRPDFCLWRLSFHLFSDASMFSNVISPSLLASPDKV